MGALGFGLDGNIVQDCANQVCETCFKILQIRVGNQEAAVRDAQFDVAVSFIRQTPGHALIMEQIEFPGLVCGDRMSQSLVAGGGRGAGSNARETGCPVTVSRYTDCTPSFAVIGGNP